VSLHKSSLGIGADFRVIYTAELSCVRCLGKSDKDFDAELHLDYVEGDDPYLGSDNVELAPHDADKVYFRGPYIDLSIGIREAIILSQPINYLCQDDCLGLCPVCGINLNVKNCTCKSDKVGRFNPKSITTHAPHGKKVEKGKRK
jgi:uncharacterized protein